MELTSTFFIAICLISSINYGYAIKCYYCDGSDECGEKMKSSVVAHQCNQVDFPNTTFNFAETKPSFHCLKMKLKYNGKSYYARGCSKTVCSDIHSMDPLASVQRCSTCTTDKCNSSTPVAVPIFLLSAMLVVTAIKLV